MPELINMFDGVCDVAPFWQTHDGVTVKLYHGHVVDVLRGLPSRSVHCCVTSPPYW